MSVDGDRHLLVAVDDSENSERAVLYVADFLGESPGFRVSLVHIIMAPQADRFEDAAEEKQWREEQSERSRRILDRYGDLLVQAGFPEEKIAKHSLRSEEGPLAEVILKAHDDLGTCTIVVGRRGKSRQEEFLFGSVSGRIVRRARKCSVWVIE